MLVSSIIKFLKNEGVKLTIIGGFYGNKSFEIKYEDEHKIEYNGRKPYYTAHSKYACDSDFLIENFVCHD